MKKLKTKTEMLRRNGLDIKSVKSVLRPEKPMVSKICERAMFRTGSERDREIWMVRMVW